MFSGGRSRNMPAPMPPQLLNKTAPGFVIVVAWHIVGRRARHQTVWLSCSNIGAIVSQSRPATNSWHCKLHRRKFRYEFAILRGVRRYRLSAIFPHGLKRRNLSP
eukprot:3868082-Lingulodinium_polyedra.AAC.1